jgi:diacylglycerol kinase (ATP)
MRVTLIHNSDAGDGEHSTKDLLAALARHGYQAVHRPKKGTDLDKVLADPGELVVAAGGDGTVAGVAKALAGRGVPLAIIPAGTANNIARSLGLPDDATPADHAARWATAKRVPFDVGHATGPDGQDRRFVESVGCGLFADMMARFERKKDGRREPDSLGGELHDARTELRKLLAQSKPRQWHVDVDGKDMSGQYLLVEAMNIRRVGPNLDLAPHADPGDGLMDVVLVRDDPADRSQLEWHLVTHAAGDPEPPALAVHRARQVVLNVGDARVHMDDAHGETVPSEITLTLAHAALTILV